MRDAPMMSESPSTTRARPVIALPVGLSHDRSVSLCTAQGRDLSEAMVRAGYALELRQHSKGRYAAAERDAREAKRGVWSGEFERPGQWRAEPNDQGRATDCPGDEDASGPGKCVHEVPDVAAATAAAVDQRPETSQITFLRGRS